MRQGVSVLGWLSNAVNSLREKALGSGTYGDGDVMYDEEDFGKRRETERKDERREERARPPLPPIGKPRAERGDAHGRPAVVQMPGTAPRASQIIIAAPAGIDDCEEICGYVRDGCAVALNLEGVEHTDAQRIVDFAAGVVAALDGEICQCTHKVFLIGPRHFTITGQHREVLRKAGIVLSLGKL